MALTRGMKTARRGQPAPELRQANYGGVFLEKGTEKYTIGTERSPNCLIRGGFCASPNREVLGKTFAIRWGYTRPDEQQQRISPLNVGSRTNAGKKPSFRNPIAAR
jgi:hypothetical protein